MIELKLVAPWELRRRTELRSELETLDSQLESIAGEMMRFRSGNMILENGRLALVSADPNSRLELEKIWRALCNRRDDALRVRNSTLAQLAELPR
jgi:hypothetical protein